MRRTRNVTLVITLVEKTLVAAEPPRRMDHVPGATTFVVPLPMERRSVAFVCNWNPAARLRSFPPYAAMKLTQVVVERSSRKNEFVRRDCTFAAPASAVK